MNHLRSLLMLTIAALFASVTFASCSSSPSIDCTPDEAESCTCDDGGDGAQICNSDGDGFVTACVCVGEPPNCSNGGFECGAVENANILCVDGECVISCHAGYVDSEGPCVDVDECATDNGGCDANATCTNEEGSFSCACASGFEGDGLTCDDRDECATDNGGCDTNATCVNTAGSFDCNCGEGWEGDGATCTDIDECADGSAQCDPNAICNNTEGDYGCTCADGFEGGQGLDCVDVDECEVDNGGCNQTCTNLDGSFECSCDDGFVLNEDGVGCDDIDECATDNGGCEQSCTNKDGAFTCNCDTGYVLGEDLHSCEDLDECATNNGGCADFCTNLVGGYVCAPEYEDLGAIITDHVHGITWSKVVIRERYCEADTSWANMDAVNLDWNTGFCGNEDTGLPDADWRLPTKEEIETVIADFGSAQAFIDQNGFTDNQAPGATSIWLSSVSVQGLGCYSPTIVTQEVCDVAPLSLWDEDEQKCLFPGWDDIMCEFEVEGGIFDPSSYWVFDIATDSFTSVLQSVYGEHWMWPVYDN